MEKYSSNYRFLNKMLSFTDDYNNRIRKKSKFFPPPSLHLKPKKKLHLIKRTHSDLNPNINWHKWMLREDKYRVSCHLKTQQKPGERTGKCEALSANKLDKARHELRRLRNIDKEIKVMKKNQHLI